MNILAIDPGFEKVGYAVMSHEKKPGSEPKLVVSGLFKTAKTDTLQKRIYTMGMYVQTLIDTHHIEHIVIEQLFFFKNAKTVIGVAQLQGALMYLASKNQIELTLLTPLEIKQIVTGYGVADKKAIQKMLRLTFGNLTFQDDDESDAIACAFAYCLKNRTLYA